MKNEVVLVGILVTFFGLSDGLELNATELERQNGDWDHSFCQIPEIEDVYDVNFNSPAPLSGGFFHPISSHEDFDISRHLLDSSNSSCIRFNHNDPDFTVITFSAFPGTPSSYFNCHKPDPEKALYKCKHIRGSDQLDLSHVTWRPLTEPTKFAFLIRCFPKLKKQTWVVKSKRSSLSHENILHVKEIAKRMGFDPKDSRTRDYSHCPEICLA